MIKIAVYGKGGIGKSTTVSHLSEAFARKGFKVMQIGCDPKADSTILLQGGKRITPILDLLRERGDLVTLDEMVHEGSEGVLCAEAGGPTPGLGCAGRGIITAFDALASRNAFERLKPDIVFYDVLGDVVCGGFAMPLRKGYADHVIVITSGENMSIYAAANLALAIDNFKDRGYATLSGVILNRRGVPKEDEKVAQFVEEIHSTLIGSLSRSEVVQKAEGLNQTVWKAFPESEMAIEYERLAENLWKRFEDLGK
ncbi:MAG: AAA family ATPase [Velocimicrobium sp.]